MFFPLAAGEGVPKNSRLGFAAKKIAPHQGSAWPNSGKALGIEAVLWEDGVRSDDGARYYNPTLQRFISEDPTDFLGGINLYAYAGNNPIGFRDPVGLKPSPGRSGQPRAWVWVPEGNGEPGHYVLVLQSDSPLTDEQRLQTVAQQTVRLAQGPMNALTVVAGVETVVIVGVEAAPLAPRVISTMDQSLELGRSIALNPEYIEFAHDFIQGYTPGAVPATLGGFAGFVTSEIVGNWPQISRNYLAN